MKTVVFLVCALLTTSAFGQMNVKEVTRLYNEGVQHFNNGEYQSANGSFRKALATNQVLPVNLSYYFAETLYYIKQYTNSRNFVERYIKIAGQGGDFYDEAVHLKSRIDEEFVNIKKCNYCNNFGYRLEPCNHCDSTGIETTECPQCKGTGNTLCPKCTGKGVVITVDAFNQNHYETCDKCAGEGVIVCERCIGEQIISRVCTYCLGTKMRPTTIICNHEEEQTELFRKKKIYRQ